MPPLLAFLDESGDHSMVNVDPSSPNFCLTLALFDADQYVNQVVPAVAGLKVKYFGHDGVILHSHDIRKERGDFSILRDANVRSAFQADLTDLMSQPWYQLIAVVIKKDDHAQRYVNPADPYELSLAFALERLVSWVEGRGGKQVTIVAEARGKRENDALTAEFYRIVSSGTTYVRQSQFAAIEMTFRCVTKAMNLPGHQIADLAAYAVARQFRRGTAPYAPFQVVLPRVYTGSRGMRYGLKIFP